MVVLVVVLVVVLMVVLMVVVVVVVLGTESKVGETCLANELAASAEAA